jgi:hypothetical protein
LEKWNDEVFPKVHPERMNERRTSGFHADDYRADRTV